MHPDHQRIRGVKVVTLLTLASRTLGLLRDALMMSFLGLTPIASAFLLAFTLPNLFRRLLGEGALSSALIPSLSHELENNGQLASDRFLNQVMTRLAILLAILTVLGLLTFNLLLQFGSWESKWESVFELSGLLFPYVGCVCLAATLGGALNVASRFAIPASSSIWLNLSMIVSLVVPQFLLKEALTDQDRALYLSLGVLFAGAIQVAVPCIALVRQGWKPRFDLSGSPALKAFGKLFLPVLWGSMVLQVNLMLSRLLALWVHDAGVAILYLSSRLVELPVGLFSVAVSTVFFPSIARFAARNDHQAFARVYQQGLKAIFWISIPATLGLVALSEPILRILFEWGAFKGSDVMEVQAPLCVSALAIPFYSLSVYTTRGLHALRQAGQASRIALSSFILHVGLSLIFMMPWGVLGLALVNTLMAIYQSIFLYVRLRAHLGKDWIALSQLLPITVAAHIMGALCYGLWQLTPDMEVIPKFSLVWRLTGTILIGFLTYASLSHFMGIRIVHILLPRWIGRPKALTSPGE